MSTKIASFVVIKEFEKALREIVIEHKEPQLLSASRFLSTTPPFPTSKKLLEAKKTVFNYTACGNEFEYDFAKFLEKAEDPLRHLPKSQTSLDFAFSTQILLQTLETTSPTLLPLQKMVQNG